MKNKIIAMTGLSLSVVGILEPDLLFFLIGVIILFWGLLDE